VRADGGDAAELVCGGNGGGAVRVGNSVRRVAGPWTPTVQRFLGHLRSQGLRGVPEPLGLDEDGRERLSYLPGVVPHYPLPDWIWNDEVLTAAVRLLSDLHQASAGFDTRDAVWQSPAHEPAEVVCHNDFAPYNMVFTQRRLTGVIDWDMASPGPRAWDVAYLAYRLVPLTDPANGDALHSSLSERARRLRLLSQTYGAGVSPTTIVTVTATRLEELAAFTDRRANEGHHHLGGHAQLYRRDARWTAAHAAQLLTTVD
jgi:Phosphotransferase enzyme family